MKKENAIEVRNLEKKFKVYYDKGNSLKERVLFRSRNRYEERWVLKGISFEVKKGEAVGLIGHNGCGKSTTLKLLNKIIYPDKGIIEMDGRISSLIELGAGFHPDMSGRENIYTNASIFGLTKRQIREREEGIIQFSELEDYIDNPVRTYSSGMYMRLAFAVAINVDADILLIDEILAVGDAAFQSKCFNKLREIKQRGTTIIIVSHALGQIEQICDRSIWIDDGRIKMDGLPAEVDYAYLDFMGKKTKKIAENPQIVQRTEEETEHDKTIEILEVEMAHEDGSVDSKFKVGEPAVLRIQYKVNGEVDEPLIGLKIYRCDNVNAYGTNTQNERIKLKLDQSGWVECRFDKLNFVASEYYVDVAFRAKDMMIYDYATKATSFTTYFPIYEDGIAHLEHVWYVDV